MASSLSDAHVGKRRGDPASPGQSLLQSLKGGSPWGSNQKHTQAASIGPTDPLGQYWTGGWLPQWARDTKAGSHLSPLGWGRERTGSEGLQLAKCAVTKPQ